MRMSEIGKKPVFSWAFGCRFRGDLTHGRRIGSGSESGKRPVNAVDGLYGGENCSDGHGMIVSRETLREARREPQTEGSERAERWRAGSGFEAGKDWKARAAGYGRIVSRVTTPPRERADRRKPGREGEQTAGRHCRDANHLGARQDRKRNCWRTALCVSSHRIPER